MKVKQALDITKTMGYNVPVDMTDDILYWSETQKEWVSILDMDIVYVVRALHGLSIKMHSSDINYTPVEDVLNRVEDYTTEVIKGLEQYIGELREDYRE